MATARCRLLNLHDTHSVYIILVDMVSLYVNEWYWIYGEICSRTHTLLGALLSFYHALTIAIAPKTSIVLSIAVELRM